MFYRSNPVLSIVIVLIALGLFLFFKARKRSKNYSGGSFFSGRRHQQDDQVSDLITLVLVQQLLNPVSKQENTKYSEIENKTSKNDDYIDNIKREILQLLED